MSEPSELLAGLSRMTVFNIKCAEADVIDKCITSAGPDAKGKFAGWLVTPDGRPLISTPASFDTAALAEEHMRKVVAAARAYEHGPAST